MQVKPEQVYLMQGALHCAAAPAVVSTVLGSCVAVCLWDRVNGGGGMNHFLLPSYGHGDNQLRYGDVAIDQLVAGMVSLGSRLGDLRAKVFGGASALCGGTEASDIGARNVEMALARLRQHTIPVVARRTGGKRGVQLRFRTWDGEAIIRTLRQPV